MSKKKKKKQKKNTRKNKEKGSKFDHILCFFSADLFGRLGTIGFVG
jgi:hypothetical protein